MKLYDYTTYENLVFCGDIHGEFQTLIYNLKRFEIENSVIIVAGDCGIGFEKESHYAQLYNKLCKSLEKGNNTLVLVRGNHDDPTYFDGERINFERMKCVPDYSVVKAAGKTVLCVGGATSIDRKHRQEAMWLDSVKGHTVRPLYWEDELVVFDESALDQVSTLMIDTVVTHTCPSFCQPISKAGIMGWLLKDDKLLGDLNAERDLMDKIYERLIADNHPLRNWYYAHFHESHTELRGDIKFSLLGIMELKTM